MGPGNCGHGSKVGNGTVGAATCRVSSDRSWINERRATMADSRRRTTEVGVALADAVYTSVQTLEKCSKLCHFVPLSGRPE